MAGKDSASKGPWPVEAASVDGGQSLGQRSGQVPHLELAQRAALGHGSGERRALDVGSDHPGRGRVRVGVDNRSGVEPIDGARDGDLASKTGPELRIGDQVGAQDLDRDLASATRNAKENLPHASRPESAKQAIRAYLSRVTGFERLHAAHRRFHGGPALEVLAALAEPCRLRE
jgi:hypothetical protein